LREKRKTRKTKVAFEKEASPTSKAQSRRAWHSVHINAMNLTISLI